MSEAEELVAQHRIEAEAPTDIDRMVKVFVKMRDKKTELNNQVKEITAQQEILEAELLRLAAAMGTTGFKTEHGTTYISEEVRFSMADELTFIDWVKQHGEVELLERRVSVKNVQEYMENHGDQLPPGLNFFKQDRMKVRRSTK